MMSSGWTVRAPGDFRARRAALLGLVERSLPTLTDEGGKSVRFDLQAASFKELESIARLRLWRLRWDCKPPVEATTEPVTASGQIITALVLSGTSAVARIGFPMEASETMGGDDIHRFLSAFHEGGSLEQVWQYLQELLEAEFRAVEPQPGTCRVGRDTPWKHMPWSRQASPDRTARATGSEKDAETDRRWTPLNLQSDDPEEEEIIAGFRGKVLQDPSVVRAAARQDFERRQRDEAWRDLRRPDLPESPEARAFFDAAERDVFGFEAPPSAQDPAKDRDGVSLRARILPFYSNTHLVEMVDRRGGYPRISRFLARFETTDGGTSYSGITPIDWKSETIHQHNAGQLSRLGHSTVRSYLEFFCQYIAGKGGYFRLPETVDGLDWLGVDSSVKNRASLFIRPIELWTPETVAANATAPEAPAAANGFLLRAQVIYDRGLFSSVFTVTRDGKVTMLADQALILGLPIAPERITAKTHFIYLKRSEVM